MAAAAATFSSADEPRRSRRLAGLEPEPVSSHEETFVDSALADEIHEIGKTPDRLFMEKMLSIPGVVSAVTREDGTLDYHAIGHDWKSVVSKTEDGREYLQMYLFNAIKCADTLITACEMTLPPLEECPLHTPLVIDGVRYGSLRRGGGAGGYIVSPTTSHGRGHFSLHRIPTGIEEVYGLEPLTGFLRHNSLGRLSPEFIKLMMADGYEHQHRLYVATKGWFTGSLVIHSYCDDDAYWIFTPRQTMVRALERGGYTMTDLPKLLTK
jgi:hypothetical protein